MPKKYNLDHFILRLLENGDLSRRQISENIRKNMDRPISNKSINEALMKLLINGRIRVVDYDISVYDGVERIQSIKSDGIVFTLIKKDPFEIGMLFKKIESDNTQEAESALKELRRLFRTKMILIGMKDYALFNRTFNKIINEILTMKPENKDKIIRRLSWALSDEKDSLKEFKTLIEYFKIKGHIK